ncbi:proline-rich extensin-like protein EPR1 [Megalops cyprinoides]|uniref:proline-rich extensin-like protein EPR1 n=1 Tax=Megalops cyprinoides TaxID=118141 RepID=UPI0018653508|nr:proline-rich extensin-like protein EPR1 [Megalops cyprinoides]
MKKGTFNHFLGRKNQSLFDTKIEIKDLDNVELVLDSSAIPESGTAKVRARPTVKHYNSQYSTPSSDVVQGFAVPTPKVPLLPPVNGPAANGTGNQGNLSNGQSMVVPDLEEGEIFIPPPPSMAPPPPPSVFIPPPVEFSYEPPQFEDPASLQPPPMPPPKPPSPAPSQEPDLASLKPPPMAPPKPPSDPSTAKVSAPISTPPTNDPHITECPNFAPPQPPKPSVERPTVTPPKSQKVPPPKPTRLSSISSMEGLPSVPAPAHVPMPSSFNPQQTAKIYNLPKTSILSGQLDREKKQKPILLLQDSDATDAIPVQVNGQVPSDAKGLDSAKPLEPPAKPARRNSSGIQLEKDLQEFKENLQSAVPSEATKTDASDAMPLEATQDTDKPAQAHPSPIPSPKLEKAPAISPPSETSLVIPQAESHSRSCKYAPYVSRNLYHRRANETSASSSTSPMALLLAAKEREKQRSSLSRENSSKRNSYSEPSTVSIHHSQSMPNSFTVVPRSTSFSSAGLRETPASTIPSRPTSATSLVAELLEKHDTEAAPTTPSPTCVKDEEEGEELCVPFIPPPPEFANSDTEEESCPEPPPSFPPPDPPTQKVSPSSSTPASQPPQVKAPTPPPKPKAGKPPAPPKLPVPKPEVEVKPKPVCQDKPKPAPPPAPTPAASSLAASQATLLSILQKKMLEMDQKHSFKEVNSSNDDWGSPLSDEESAVPAKPSPLPKSKSANTLSAPPSKAPGLDMKELERKVAKKAQDLSNSAKSATSNGSQSKQPYGMTFTVRPGSKQPITPVTRGESP